MARRSSILTWFDVDDSSKIGARIRSAIKWGSLVLAGASAVAGLLLTSAHIGYRRTLDTTAYARAAGEAADIAERIDVRFKDLMAIADTLAAEIGRGDFGDPDALRPNTPNTERLFARLHEVYDDSALAVFSVGIGFESQKQRTAADSSGFAMQWRPARPGDPPERSDSMRGVYHEEPWYSGPWSSGAGMWIQPYPSITEPPVVYSEYAVPFPPGAPPEGAQGVVFIDYTTTMMQGMVDSMDLGRSGYGFIISDSGVFAAHPNRQYVLSRHLIENDVLERLDDSATIRLTHQNSILGRNAHYTLATIPSADWHVGVAFHTQPDFETARRSKRRLMLLGLIGLAFLTSLSSIVLRLHEGRIRNFWIAVCVFTVTSGALTWYVWTLQGNAQLRVELPAPRGTETSNDAADGRCQLFDASDADLGSDHPVFNRWDRQHVLSCLPRPSTVRSIPTGMFVQSIEQLSSIKFIATGYVWQKFATRGTTSSAMSVDSEPGFLFPEAEAATITEAYRRCSGGMYRDDSVCEGDYEVVGWYFQATLVEQTDPINYPLDREDLWFRIWPNPFDKDVVLVPDLESYSPVVPASLPGIDIGFVLPGWSLESSFFSYRLNQYNTNFGTEQPVQLGDLPELYFNIILRREVIGPFVSSLLPLLVVAVMLFALLMLIHARSPSGESDAYDLVGFNAAGHLASCTALFFVVILSHIDLRRQVESNNIVYMESFYFIAYVAILAVAMNAVMVGQRTPLPGILYKDNLLPKLLFWPFILVAVLGMTLRYFY